MRAHPDRCATTLATLAEASARQGDGPFAPPGAGAADCRIDLKLLQWRALQACARSERARQRLAAHAALAHPDLWAGTVQDGTARGFAAALEEAISLAPAPVAASLPAVDPTRTQTFTGKELRKKKDLLVAGAAARVRWSRKEGLLLVDRDAGVHSANCLRFEARTDRGTLDGFVAPDDERARLFSAQFLQPQRYCSGPTHAELVLAGRLGRTAAGFACELVLRGSDQDPRVQLVLRIDNRHHDHRLRARFLGVPPTSIAHDCTDVREVVHGPAGGFVAFSLVRACGRLTVDGAEVAVPAAQCPGRIEHTFWLGPAPRA